MELSAGASEKEATEAVLFPDTSELGWATRHEEGATESWLSGSELQSCSHFIAKFPLMPRRASYEDSAPTQGPRASAALLCSQQVKVLSSSWTDGP